MRIGIAGGIGSGKSYVCERIRQRGFEVYDCDRSMTATVPPSASSAPILTSASSSLPSSGPIPTPLRDSSTKLL